MKCHILFSKKIRKNIICLSSAESVRSMVSVKRKFPFHEKSGHKSNGLH